MAKRGALAELHVHLEGTVRYETALELAAANAVPPPPPYRYSDLPGFFQQIQPPPYSCLPLMIVAWPHSGQTRF